MLKQTLLTDINEKRCFKCGSTKHVIVHHISYHPEKTVLCCQSCHKKIHYKVRKLGLCPLSVDETHKLSRNSSAKRINKKTIKTFLFYTHVMYDVGLFEYFTYNIITGHLFFGSYFRADHGKSIYYLKE